MGGFLATAYPGGFIFPAECGLPLAWPTEGEDDALAAGIEVVIGPALVRRTPPAGLEAPGLAFQFEGQRLVACRRIKVSLVRPQGRLCFRQSEARVDAAHLFQDRRSRRSAVFQISGPLHRGIIAVVHGDDPYLQPR